MESVLVPLLSVKAAVAEVSATYASAAVFIAAISLLAADTLPDIMNPETFGIITAARMPRMAMTINNSIRVKPFAPDKAGLQNR